MSVGVKVTINGWNKIREIIKQSKNKYGLLYSASSGGCSGFNFELGLLDETTYRKMSKMKYVTILIDIDATVYVDPTSEMFLLGTTIDYIKEDYSKGQFENKFIFEVDKELLSTCGCGTSFTPK
jgi:iron-sulfur cluster assembly accessory protein